MQRSPPKRPLEEKPSQEGLSKEVRREDPRAQSSSDSSTAAHSSSSASGVCSHLTFDLQIIFEIIRGCAHFQM